MFGPYFLTLFIIVGLALLCQRSEGNGTLRRTKAKHSERQGKKNDNPPHYNQILRNGYNASIDCGIPLPERFDRENFINWKKNETDLELIQREYELDEPGHIEVSGDKVLLRNITEDDAGLYRCEAVLGDRTKEAFTTVEVLEEDEYAKTWEESLGSASHTGNSVHSNDRTKEMPPALRGRKPYWEGRSGPLVRVKMPGEREVFGCFAGPKNDPVPLGIRWFKNDIPMLQDKNRCSENKYRNSMFLCLDKLTVNDTGIYGCEAYNIFGSISRTMPLFVAPAAAGVPTVEKVVVRKETRVGGVVRLHCEVTSSIPLPTEWMQVAGSEKEDLHKCDVDVLARRLEVVSDPLIARNKEFKFYQPIPTMQDLLDRKFKSQIDVDPEKSYGAYVCHIIHTAEMRTICVARSSKFSSKDSRQKQTKHKKASRTTTTAVLERNDVTTSAAFTVHSEPANEIGTVYGDSARQLNSTEVATVLGRSTDTYLAGILAPIIIVLVGVILPAFCIAYCKHRRSSVGDPLVGENRVASTSLQRSTNVDYIVPAAVSILPAYPYSTVSLQKSSPSMTKYPLPASRENSNSMVDPHFQYRDSMANRFTDDNMSMSEYFKHPPSMVSSYAYSAYTTSKGSQNAVE